MAGLVVFALFAVAAAVAAMTGRLTERAAMLSGLALLPPSLGMLVAAHILHSMPLLLGATVLAGLASALGYRGSLEIVNRIAPNEQRSEVVSSYLIAVYLGNSIPVIGVGVLSEWLSSLTTHIAFASVITILAVGALTGSGIAVRSLQRDRQRPR